MFRHVFILFCVAGCVTEDAEVESSTSIEQAASLGFSREHVTGDIYHYELVLPIGGDPNAALRLHRVVREIAPFVPRHTSHAAMALHGDFSTFLTNFAPTLGEPASPVLGLAPYLAARNVDVWGLDRRWTLPDTDDDISDLGAMGVAQELDDLRAALAFARAARLVGGSGGGKLALIGFSHGAQLAYAYAAVEGARPAALRHVDALVPLDFFGELGPEQEAERVAACGSSAAAYDDVADGVIDSPNDFQILLGELAIAAPDEPSPIFDDTNRGAALFLLGQTYVFVPYAPFYHLLAPILDGDAAVGLSETSEPAAFTWFAGATPHSSLREAADFDKLLCGEGVMPVDATLSRIHVPLFYIGAAGGVGSLGLHTTTQVASTDVTTLVVQRFGPEDRAIDFGHADLLFADDAPSLVWQPLAAWLAAH
jgi:hypothetical protein